MNSTATTTRLAADAELVFPLSKRVITQYLKNEQGQDALFLFYGDQEISFDEPELFAFGEALGAQSRFAAGAATGWGTGYAWEQVQALLEQLLQAGILEHAAPLEAQTCPMHRPDGDRASPLPPATSSVARTWLECEAITRELTGRSIELAHLELVIPVFRIAHLVQDAEGRQVGEANVFPKALRLEVPTRWRACIYPGSRYQDSRPMNVSALKSMRAHWPAMMAAILRIREAYLQRFPAARTGWTVGDVERLSTLVLAVPTYMLMKSGQTVANGALHPVLSNLFRVTDGVRMTTHQMLFVPVAEATLSPLAPINSAELYAYAERNHAFGSTHGVCAGPRVMIEEFLGVLLDGQVPAATQGLQQDAAVEAALAEMEQAFDYGLLGLQAHAVVFSLWPLMTRTYEQMHTIATQWRGPQSLALARLRRHLQDKVDILKNETLHATEAWRANREQVYADIFVHCAQGLGQPAQHSLPELVKARQASPVALRQQLRALLRAQFSPGQQAVSPGVEALTDCLAHYFLQSQALLAIAVDIQADINALLQRAPALWAFSAADLDVHVLLQGSEARHLPHLLDELENLLGFKAVVSRESISLFSSIPVRSHASCARPPQFADMVLADTRA
ncbi:hypothetical protein DIC66_11405 [Rhodoferax lacus]|uniref:Uncharacterized protein n=1 Tax=Rhodoferax lacus TaxID=2184758 RepID=A0A3E1RB91_9BURK|nr:hypothetical protein [Rhodoferax lacus]RFO96626.1 hypothetical protein DIC66_11405 [Rhodoferax lacus]